MSFDSILNQQESLGTGVNQPELVFSKIVEYLKQYQKLVLDFKETKTMSPSFAYVAFGKLYDIYGENVLDRIQIDNDSMNLRNRIKQALERRAQVIKFERA